MTIEAFLAEIERDPLIGEVKSNDDESKYIPISIIQNKMDILFGGDWTFVMTRETFGKNAATGCGTLEFHHPVTGNYVRRSGTAAVSLGKELRLDYPKLEAMVFLNAAKKIGKYFGRDLNREKDDAPFTIQVEKNEEDEEGFDQVVNQILGSSDSILIDELIKSTYGWKLRLNDKVRSHLETLKTVV